MLEVLTLAETEVEVPALDMFFGTPLTTTVCSAFGCGVLTDPILVPRLPVLTWAEVEPEVNEINGHFDFVYFKINY